MAEPETGSPGLFTRVVRGFLLWLFGLQGWRVEGQAPTACKCVIIGAPHTSNWDFLVFMGVTDHFGIHPGFMGKNSLFHWPMRRFMLDMGGVPVNRSASGNYVDAMVDEFARRAVLQLVVAPEGTRGKITSWRSGFYHIAHKAGVPIIPAWVDIKTRRAGLGPQIETSGDFRADMQRLSDFYRSVLPGHPKLEVLHAMATAGVTRPD